MLTAWEELSQPLGYRLSPSLLSLIALQLLFHFVCELPILQA